jgi:hypothetical protein
MRDIQVNEAEWYLRDHLFRRFNKNKKQFKKESLASEMINLYLRYRNSNLQQMTDIITVVVEKLVFNQVLKQTENNNSLELTEALYRLQCSKCFYISYLSSNEIRKCLRCSSVELHDFPKKNNQFSALNLR